MARKLTLYPLEESRLQRTVTPIDSLRALSRFGGGSSPQFLRLTLATGRSLESVLHSHAEQCLRVAGGWGKAINLGIRKLRAVAMNPLIDTVCI